MGPDDDELLGLCARETTTSGARPEGGGDGRDFLSDGTGNDSLYGGDGADYLDCGAGIDTLAGGDGNDRLAGSAESGTFLAKAGRTSSSSRAASTGSWVSSPAWTGSRSPT